MKLKLFACHDSKAGAFMQPFFFQATGQAIRAFSDTVNDPKTQLNRHPADFTLFELGTFDDQTGEVETIKPLNLGVALSFLNLERETAPLFNKLPVDKE